MSLCDWYLEVIKPALTSKEGGDASRAVLASALEQTLRLLHPVIPFITEEIWQKLPHRTGESIMVAAWPTPREDWDDPQAEAEFSALMELVGGIRNIRGELNISPNKEMPAHLQVPDPANRALILREAEWIRRLARIAPDWQVASDVERPKASANAVFGCGQAFVPIGGLIDVEEELKRLEKQIAEAEETAAGLEKKLANPAFVERAPAEIVEKDRLRLHETQARAEKLRESAARIAELQD